MNITFKEPVCSDKTRPRFSRILIFAMRTGFFYTVLVVSTACTLLANHDGNGQAIDSTYVTLEIKNETLKTLLKKIENQTHLRFSFLSTVKDFPIKDLPKKERSVKEVLDLAVQKDLSYHQINNSYVVIKELKALDSSAATKDHNTESPVTENVQPLFLLTGSVTDAATKEPLPGVNVIVKGTSKGTTTDVKGNYTIEVENDDVLVFTFIGFKAYETPVNGRSVINLSMEVDTQTLKEVEVNAGYWKVKDRERTGNISKIGAEEIQKQPVSNPLAALEGRMPGVYIQQTTGVPGGGINVEIRGRNSLRHDGNYPLYVIDGVPFISTIINTSNVASEILGNANPLNNISPANIESIEILKDADATAIYGSRGANGVVLITTKKGKSGRTKIDLIFNQGVGKVTRTMDLLNTKQWLEMRKEAYRNDGITPAGLGARDLVLWDTTRYTDWQKLLIGGTAKYTNAQASLSGGSNNTKFILDATYYRETTVFPGDFAFQRGSSHFALDHSSLENRLNLNLSINYSISSNNLPNTDLTAQGISLQPNAPRIYDENGNLNWENSTWVNPYGILRRRYEGKSSNLITNALVDYEILPQLHIKSSFGYNLLLNNEVTLIPINSFNPSLVGITGQNTTGTSALNSWIIEPQLDYSITIGKGKLNLLAGLSFQNSEQQAKTLRASGFTNDASIENLLAAPSISILNDRYTDYRYSALFARIHYSWKDRYILNMTGRRDGSSRFGPGNQFANFGAVGAAWIFSSESFATSVQSFLSFGKLRASYGITGSDQIGDYQYLDSYSTLTNTYNGIIGITPSRLANPDYSWETNKKLEAALELGFFHDRILLSTSVYRNRSSNQLVGYPLAAITGQSSIQYNLPATVQNTGAEFIVDSKLIQHANFSWSASANITIPRNKLIKYPNISASSYANVYEVGEPLSIKKVFRYTGVNPETGVYTFEDIDESGVGTDYPADLQPLKNLSRDYFGGINNAFRYKGFQLDIFIQFVKQTGYNYLYYFSSLPGSRFNNHPTVVMDRWQKPGDISNIQRFSTTGEASTAYYFLISSSDRAYSDASFIRVKNVSLSWQLPQGLKSKLRISDFRIYLQGQNLFTLTNYLGYDPETQNAKALPPLRVLTAGLKISL